MWWPLGLPGKVILEAQGKFWGPGPLGLHQFRPLLSSRVATPHIFSLLLVGNTSLVSMPLASLSNCSSLLCIWDPLCFKSNMASTCRCQHKGHLVWDTHPLVLCAEFATIFYAHVKTPVTFASFGKGRIGCHKTFMLIKSRENGRLG